MEQIQEHTPTEITGLVRLGDNTEQVIADLDNNDIAVINEADLDRATALELIEAGASAVLNAAPCVTGRYPTKGASELLAAGVPVIDTLGAKILALKAGQRVRIEGANVYLANQLVAAGIRLTPESNQAALAGAQLGMSDQLRSFSANTGDFLDAEHELLFNGAGLDLGLDFSNRPVVVVPAGKKAAQELESLYRFIKDRYAAVIGVGAGANTAYELGLDLDLITGNLKAVKEEVLVSGAKILLHTHTHARAQDPRLEARGLAYSRISTSLAEVDLATLAAAHAGSKMIVVLGGYETLEEFFDLGRLKMSSAFFTQLVAKNVLVSPAAVLQAYSRPLRASYIWLLLSAALLALIGALRLTPLGYSLWLLLPTWGQWATTGGVAAIAAIMLISLLLTLKRGKK